MHVQKKVILKPAEMAAAKLCCLLLALLTLSQSAVRLEVIVVSSDCSVTSQNATGDSQACINIDQAIDMTDSDTQLSLSEGIHYLTQPRVMRDTSNIMFVGASESGVHLECVNASGIGFVNVTGLVLANVTIHSCGLTGESLQAAMDLLKDIVNVWSAVPQSLSIGLFLGHCQDLSMSHVTVNGTRGLGMLAINIVGNSTLSHVNFTHNVRPRCWYAEPFYPFDVSGEIVEQIGGGAYFLYHDYHNESSYDTVDNSLLISDSFFAHNADCSFSVITHLSNKYFDYNADRFTVGAGGGLSIIYGHSHYSLSARVRSTRFFRNDARYGSGAYVGTFADFIYENFVIFDNCTFLENGLVNVFMNNGIEQSYCRSGGGLAILTDLLKPDNLERAISHVQNVSISAVNTHFIQNGAAIEGGGVYAYSLVNSPHGANSPFETGYFSVQWSLVSCTFHQNQAYLSVAASFIQRVYYSIDGIVLLYLDSVTVSENAAHFSGLNSENEISSAFSLQNVVTIFRGNLIFAENHITAMHVVSSFCFIAPGAVVEYERNIGKRGGALYIEGISPAFFFETNATMRFRMNSALVEGGAVYISALTYTDVTLQPLNHFGCLVNPSLTSLSNFFESGIKIEFAGNSAPIGGVMYGGTVDSCSWSDSPILNFTGRNLLAHLYDNKESTFVFDRRPEGKDQVSTRGFEIRVNTPDKLIPGEEMDVNIDVFDGLGNEIYAVVSSEVLESFGGECLTVKSSSANSTIGQSGFWYTSINSTALRIFGPQERANICLSFFTFGEVIRTLESVDLLSCPAGFVYNETTRACVCSEEVFEHSHSELVQCDDLAMKISTTSSSWFGKELHLVNSTELDDLIIHDCHFGYCELNSTFRPPNYDAQCRNGSNRTGVLCGGCAEGYSVVFGTSDCRTCRNFNLFIIPVFVIAGILVFLAIAFLEFTVDKGWLFAVIFYCNIVTLYSFSPFPNYPAFNFILVPAHLLSLEIGFGLCFFDGMTAVHRSLIQFLFPAYLHLLMLIFGLLSRRFSLSCYFNPAKTFLTIMMLCYVSLLNTCIEILAGHSVHTVKDVVSVRWIIDANQLYFRGLHAFAGVIAFVVLIGYLGLSTVIVLFPSLVYRYLKAGKPLYDALYAPFKQKYRFWIGIRLLARVVIISVGKFVITDRSIVANLVLLALLLHIQTNIRPYKSKSLNFVDSFLITNVIILYIGILSRFGLPFSPSELTTLSLVYAYFFISIAYVVIICIFGYHLDCRFPNIRVKLTRLFRAIIPKKASNSNMEISMHQRSTLNRLGVTTTSLPGIAQVDTENRELPLPVPAEPAEPVVEEQEHDSDTDSGNYRDSILETI